MNCTEQLASHPNLEEKKLQLIMEVSVLHKLIL